MARLWRRILSGLQKASLLELAICWPTKKCIYRGNPSYWAHSHGPQSSNQCQFADFDTETGRGLVWLGIDLRADEWLKNISLARLQTIIIAGLVLALIIFFIYYQIENESETDLALAKERAEAADRAKSEFLAVMSHEIRTPLQSVLGYSNLLKNTRLDEKQMSCLDTIQSKGKILLRIVQDILDFSNSQGEPRIEGRPSPP